MRHHLLTISLLVALAAQAKTINVADHGIVPGKDCSFALNQLIESVKNEPNVTLVFPKGTYDFHPENAVEVYRAVSNHDNGLKRMVFPLFNMKNVTIDGGGSDFVMHGLMTPVVLESVDGATLRNFSINWGRSWHAEFTILESNEKDGSFIAEIDPEKYPFTLNNGELLFQRYTITHQIGSNMLWDPATRSPIHNTRDYRLNAARAKIKQLAPNRLKFENAMKKAPPVGTILVTYGEHPISRLASAIHITNSKDIRIENVTVYDAGGMALIVERTDNITLDGMVVCSAEDRIVATRADATHFIGCKGTIKLENCELKHMLDDGINVHGAYVKVAEYIGDNTFICEISHFQQWGLIFAEPGDKIALLSRETILPFHESTVTGFKILNEHRFVLEIADTPAELPEGPLSVENLTWYPDLVMRNNKIHENRARSVLVTTKGKVLIENNYFSSQMHGILIEGDNNWWYESGAVEDVTIRNNVFNNIGFAIDNRYPLIAAPLLRPEQRIGEGHYHRNINFVGNTIKSFNGAFVNAKSVKGLNVSNNILEFSTDYPKTHEGPSVLLEYCDDITIRNNVAKGFDRELEIEASGDTTNLKTSKNKGFKAN
ncbi:MAG: right-handed parallel beta-helix repeat-containing protein [Puniceicoccaceae bacterium]